MEFMQPNPGSEYRIPQYRPEPLLTEQTGYEIAAVDDFFGRQDYIPQERFDFQAGPVDDLIGAIKNSEGVNELHYLESKRWISPVCKRMMDIGETIQKARELHMDHHFFFTEKNNDVNFIASAFNRIFNHGLIGPISKLLPVTRDNLINEESRLSGKIFGEQPNGQRIEFFYYGKDEADRERWYCKKEMNTAKGNEYVILCYEVQDDRILKIITKGDGSKVAYEFLEGEELEDFVLATEKYHNFAMKDIYGHEGCLGDDFVNYIPTDNTPRYLH